MNENSAIFHGYYSTSLLLFVCMRALFKFSLSPVLFIIINLCITAVQRTPYTLYTHTYTQTKDLDCILVAIKEEELFDGSFRNAHKHADRLNEWSMAIESIPSTRKLLHHRLTQIELNFHGNSNEIFFFFAEHYNKFYLLPIWKRFLYYSLFDEILPQNDRHYN